MNGGIGKQRAEVGIVRRHRRRNQRQPKALYVSGARAPIFRLGWTPPPAPGDEQFLAELRRRISARQHSEVQAERVRIARELHDVLAHSLSQINVQAACSGPTGDREMECYRQGR